MSDKTLIKLAPSMNALLTALKDLPFEDSSDNDSVVSATSSERSETLSAMLQILHDQADHDGFRLITINAEPKRIILACNRQGRSPQKDAPEEEDAERKKGNRAGTSIRCGCRMRVNINFHSKLGAWRVTSFESAHNHSYGSGEPNTDQYDLSVDAIRSAITKFCESRRQNDAVMALTEMMSMPATPAEATFPSSASFESSSAPTTGASTPKSPSDHTPIRIHISDLEKPTLLEPSMSPMRAYGRPRSATLAPPQHRFHFGRMVDTQRRRAQTISVPEEPMGGLKSLTHTAIEVDRYAMLYSSLKRLIATACKKREWAEMVMDGMGRCMERMNPGGERKEAGVPSIKVGGGAMLPPIMTAPVREHPGLVSPLPSLKRPLDDHAHEHDMKDADGCCSGHANESMELKRLKIDPVKEAAAAL